MVRVLRKDMRQFIFFSMRGRHQASIVAALAVVCFAFGAGPAAAQGAQENDEVILAEAAEGGEGVSKKLTNPIASLVSVPFQFNWDMGVGPEDGRRFIMNFQPVLPFSLNEDLNLITRLIAPVVAQPVLTPGGDPSSGLGDFVLSAFVSPKEGGVVWGAGPVVTLPITSDPTLGTGKFGLGPTGVVLKMAGPWTVGALANHVWSVGGDDWRGDVSQTFLQPFVSYTTNSAFTFTMASETTCNWEVDRDRSTVPINLVMSKLVTVGERPISVGAGVRFYPEAPPGGPEWGFRLNFVLLFPTAG